MRFDVELVANRRAVEVILLEPAELLAVRAVGEHRHHVRPLSPAHERADAVQQFVRALEVADRLGRRMDDHAFELFELRQVAVRLGRHLVDLQVAAAGVEELREPGLRLVGRLGVLPLGRAAIAAAGVAVDRAVAADDFGVGEPHGAARRTSHANPRHVRGVLAEVDDVASCR